MNTQRTLLCYPFMALALLLASCCGFQLRGLSNIAPELKILDINTTDHLFNQNLIAVLKTNGITVNDTGDYRLRILPLERENKEVTLSGGGIVSDYELTGILTWHLETNSGLALFPPRKIRMSRTYQYSYNHATASRSEEDLIWHELTQKLAISLIHQVSTISSQQLATLTANAKAVAEAEAEAEAEQ
ncbi:MAG: hypothetical protein KAG53_03430 [Endozoicomonadaceae bacterium]|nr:hypothetical protein [Endozoicomonadaceae bacterium]